MFEIQYLVSSIQNQVSRIGFGFHTPHTELNGELKNNETGQSEAEQLSKVC